MKSVGRLQSRTPIAGNIVLGAVVLDYFVVGVAALEEGGFEVDSLGFDVLDIAVLGNAGFGIDDLRFESFLLDSLNYFAVVGGIEGGLLALLAALAGYCSTAVDRVGKK